MQFAQLNGVTLHYQIIGAAEDKPVLVFSNSLGTDHRIWRDVIVQFVGDYAVVAYDKRGHGLSDLGDVSGRVDDHVDDLAALLDHLNVRNAVICGLSVGGLIAMGLWKKRPDLTRALVLCDTGHKIGAPDMWDQRIATAESEGIEVMADAIVERWFTETFRRPDNPEFRGYRNLLTRTTPAGYAEICRVLRDTDYTELAPTINVPALCLVGAEDRATPPELVRELSVIVPGAEYVEIPGSGHLPCIEQPHAMADEIKRFLSALPAD